MQVSGEQYFKLEINPNSSRIRHVKCSGERPVCLRCIGIGRKCEGYPSSKESSSARRFVDFPSTSTAQTTSVSSYAIPFRMPGSQQDRQLVHYFCVAAMPSHMGYLSSDYETWGYLLVQYMQEDAVVRQAVVAYSSGHADYILGTKKSNGQTDQVADTVRLYGKAIRRLRNYIATTRPPSIRTVLTCCFLFYCFESTRADHDAALEHLQTGLRILQEAKSARSRSQNGTTLLTDDIETLTRVFSRLDTQASASNETRMPSLCVVSDDERAGITPLIPKTSACSPLVSDASSWGPLISKTSASRPLLSEGSIWSIGDAHHVSNKLGNWLFSFLVLNHPFKSVPKAELPAQLVAEKNELLWQYRNYSVALEKLMQQNKGLPHGHVYEIASVLKLSHLTKQMLLKSTFPEDLRVFGASPNPAAEEILDLAQSLVNHSIHSGITVSKHSLPLHLGIVDPIPILALKCLDIRVCERALAILASANKPEGLIDSEIMVVITQRIKRLKEQQHIPQFARGATSQQAELRDGDCNMPLGARGAEPTERELGSLHKMANLMKVRYVASGIIFLLPKVSGTG